MNVSRSASNGPVRLNFSYKLIWGLASLGTSSISATFGGLLAKFYLDDKGLDPSLYWKAWLIYTIWNAINDPLFGYITDSTRSKHGRRIPYMRLTAPFLAVAFLLVWMVPNGASDLGMFWWMLVTMLLYDTAYTMIGLVYSALLPEVSESDAERNGLQISSSLFGLVGTIIGFQIPDMFRPKAGMPANYAPLQIAMAVMALIAMVLIVVTTLKVKERPEFTVADKPLGLWESIKYTFTSKSFLIVVAANFMSILMQALLLAMIYFVADYVMHTGAMTLLLFLFVPLIIGVPVTTFIRARLGVVQAQQVLLLIAGIGLVSVVFVPASLIPLCVGLAGFGLSGPQTLTNILFAQVADEDELRSGVRREGAFFGVNAMLTKPAQFVGNALISAILVSSLFVTTEQNGGQMLLNQPASAIFGIKVLFGLIPGIAMLVGAGILFLYPLRGKHLAAVQEKVLAMHAEKHARLNGEGDQQAGAGAQRLTPGD